MIAASDRSRTLDLAQASWRLMELAPGEWTRDDLFAHAATVGGRIAATVPGSIARDLARAGLVDDPYTGLNSRRMEWVATRTWVYATTVTVPASWRGSQVLLRCEQVDFQARFAVEGHEVGEHASMSTPAVFDVSDRVRWGEPTLLAVALAPAPVEQDQLGRTSLVRSLKSRMGYGWDFCPRIVDMGLTGAVSLVSSGPVRVADLRVRSRVDAGTRHADITAEVALDGTTSTPTRVLLTVTAPDGSETSREQLIDAPTGASRVGFEIHLDDADLWWPNGYGRQPLYLARVTVEDDDGVTDRASTRFGLRRIEMRRNATSDATAAPYALVCNGVPVYAAGWNWVPPDALRGGASAQRRDHLLDLAARAHVVLLRVNGVGVIEDEAFYDRCDELGIMVWQEFLLTSSAQDRRPTDDRAYVDAVVAEARGIVRTRRGHPSLVAWGAGNELEGDDKLPLDDATPVIGALRDVVRALDPDAHWFATSPTGRLPFPGPTSIRTDPDGLHDVHGPWLYDGPERWYDLFNSSPALLHSEFGVEALADEATLRDVLPAGDLALDRLDSPTWRHLSAWWVRPDEWREWLGEVDDLDKLVRATQTMQAEGVRYAVEANRRRIPRNSGSLPWQFDEPYPMAACTTAVDHRGRPRPVYHAVARAYRPLALSARYDRWAWGGHDDFSAELWAVDARGVDIRGGVVTARVLDAHGAVAAAETFPCARADRIPRAVGRVGCRLAALGTDAFVLDAVLTDADGVRRASWRSAFSRTHDLAPVMRAPTADVAVSLEGDATAVILHNRGESVAFHVRVADGRPVRAAGYAVVADSHLILTPSETVRIGVGWRGVAPQDRVLEVSGGNVAPRRLGAG